MDPLTHLWRSTRGSVARLLARRAARLNSRDPKAADRWLVWAAGLAPEFGQVHREAVAACRRTDDRLGAVARALRISHRFPDSPDAWILLGEAYAQAFRPRDALVAYERSLQIEERPDAAMAAGTLYLQRGDPATAGARFARAFAAGAGPEALRANARALKAAGDPEAARQAREMWERETGKAWED